MKTLELKHLAPYLPYGLKGLAQNEDYTGEIEAVLNLGISEITTNVDAVIYDSFKPILRPLSDLAKNGDEYEDLFRLCHDVDENLDYLCEFNGSLLDTSLSYRAVDWLLSKHYDVFGLIKDNLATDINQLKQ